jgi:hypothetical protein
MEASTNMVNKSAPFLVKMSKKEKKSKEVEVLSSRRFVNLWVKGKRGCAR